nr:MAG: membrane protein [Bacteroidota bacterium]
MPIDRLLYRALGTGVLLVALGVYGATMAPTASFWDCGEFIATAHGLQIPHPPGAPFYLLLGRIFSMWVPDSQVALAVNLISVLASAFTVLLLYLTIVRLIFLYRGQDRAFYLERSAESSLTPAEAIAIFGGSATGALVFAFSDSFWFNAVEAEVYAPSMLFTALVVYLALVWHTRAEEWHHERWLLLISYLFGLAIGVHLLNLLTLFFVTLIYYFRLFESDRPLDSWPDWKRLTGVGVLSVGLFVLIYPGIVQWLPALADDLGLVPFVVLLIGGVTAWLYWTQRRQRYAGNLVALATTLILIGYSSYALIVIRSQADPPIDENDPETAEAFVSYLKREQYGYTPLLVGRSYDNRTGWFVEEKLFPRRWSEEPSHVQVYRQYASDWDFFWRYQVGHMYLRYLLWNFVGRDSDIQDAPWTTGFTRTGNEDNPGHNTYFALPLLLGLIGMAYHVLRDRRRALAVLVLFFMTGLAIVLYLNQPPLQPRERDYSYVGSFFAFSIWAGIGAKGLLELLIAQLRLSWHERRAAWAAALGLGVLLLIPLRMLWVNWDDHDRSGNYVPPDYAYNLLNSCEKNAILFTNGDNDTFPLWYLQEVEGVRRDVRVVNLSLLNTTWYILQLKHQASRQSPPIRISLSDEEIRALAPREWQPQTIRVPLDPQAARRIGLVRQGELLPPALEWRYAGRRLDQNRAYVIVSDLLVLDIVRQNLNERPIYFATTVSRDNQAGLQNFFQLEGLAYRVVPFQTNEPLGRVIPELLEARLASFRYRNLNNPRVYYDENTRRLIDNYRNFFIALAGAYRKAGKPDRALATLDRVQELVPFSVIPSDGVSYLLMAQEYAQAGARERALGLAREAERVILAGIERRTEDPDRSVQMLLFLQRLYLEMEGYEEASQLSQRLARLTGDPNYAQSPEQMRELARTLLRRDTVGNDTLN